jgi:hypothetical protein
LLVRQRFGTSARKGENGFVPRRIVSSPRLRRNNPASNASEFKGMDLRPANGPIRAKGLGAGDLPRDRRAYPKNAA